MNYSLNRLYALCLLAALVITPLASRTVSHKRCAITKPGTEGVWNKVGLIADGPNNTPWPKALAGESTSALTLPADGPNNTPWPKALAGESISALTLPADGPNNTPWPKALAGESISALTLPADGPNNTPWPKARLEASRIVG